MDLGFWTGLRTRTKLGAGAIGGGVSTPFSPSDITGLRLWLRADLGVFTDGGTTPATSDGDAIGQWQDQSGNGYHVSQTLTKRPLLKLAANGINGQPVILFDGSNDILVRSVSDWLITDSAGTCFAVIRLTTSPNATGTILASEDEGGPALSHVIFETDTSTNLRMDVRQRNNNDVNDIVRGGTTLTADTVYYMVWRSDGSAYTLKLNGADETLSLGTGANSGDWFADTTLRDNLTVGGLKFSSEANFLKGSIAEIVLYNSFITGADLTNLNSYIASRYGLSLP